jgi:hypothetical protein
MRPFIVSSNETAVKRDTMIARILIMVMAGLLAIPLNGMCGTPDTGQCRDSLTSCECSFVRKQWFQGQSRIAKGRFFFDCRSRSACYDYSSPFHYRFIVNDTAVFGIDKKNNRGYALLRSADPQQYDEVYLSVHLFGQFLRSITDTADQAADSVRGSVDSTVYLEKKTGSGCDMIAMTRETGRAALIESFDENGVLIEQSRMAYDKRNDRTALPSRLIVKKRSGDVVTLDTLAVSGGRINTTVMPQRFTVPPECRLAAFSDIFGK